jgi:hypothetical protein
MARSITQLQNTIPPGPNYQYGDIRDRAGATSGTPVDREGFADQFQFWNRLMDVVDIPFNGLPDNDAPFPLGDGRQFSEAVAKYVDNNYRELILKLSQTGTSNPGYVQVKNNILDPLGNPMIPVPVRTNPGLYYLEFDPVIGKDYMLIVSQGTLSDTTNDIVMTAKLAEGDLIRINTTLSGLASDGVLDHVIILREVDTQYYGLGDY